VKNRLVVLTLIAAVLATTGIAGQSRPPSLQGAWKAVEITVTGPSARTLTSLQPNLTVISAKHYARVDVQSDGPRPILTDVTNATADQLRAVWGPFVAEAGTYELTEDTLTLHPIAAKNPAAMVAGAVIVYACKLEGNTLTLTQQRNQSGPYPDPVTFKLTRVE
jgi:hypothetical protein